MSDRPYLSVIIPAYNEEANIGGMLSEVSEYLKDKDFSSEVIVIDDGSKDATVSEARRFENTLKDLRVMESKPNRGKGYVLKKAVLEARGENIVFLDADRSVTIDTLDDFLPLLGDDVDILIASRRVPGAKVSMPAQREVLGKVYIFFAKALLGININDINCGFKLFKNDAAKLAFSKQTMDDWSFDAEILYIAGKHGFRIREVPVEWEYKDTSKVRPLRDGINSFVSLVRIKGIDLKGKYD